jgi:hypothetical protein
MFGARQNGFEDRAIAHLLAPAAIDRPGMAWRVDASLRRRSAHQSNL